MTDYPNAEHRNKDQAARTAAIEALAGIMRDAQALGRQLANPHARMLPFAADAQPLHNAARVVTEKLTILETLRGVREWHEADKAERKGHVNE